MNYLSPLRYPGGKSKLSKYIEGLVTQNGLFGGTYAEPFAGGAGVALSLLLNRIVSRVIINDINLSIYAFWYSVLNHTDELCRLINDVNVNIDEWYKQRKVQQNKTEYNHLELGFSTFFLNRTNRSGIIADGGVIGGINQKGLWKMDARFNKVELIKRIERIAFVNNRIELYNMDTAKLIKSVITNLPLKSLIFFDPPYYAKGSELYENHYNNRDHKKLAKAISGLKIPWIITYDNVPEIQSIYKNFNTLTYTLSYSAAKRYQGSEIMIFCDLLKIPQIDLHGKAI